MAGLTAYSKVPMDIIQKCSFSAVKVWGCLTYFTDWNDPKRLTQPSHKAIGKFMELSVDSVKRGIQELIDIGRLIVYSGKEVGMPNRYVPNFLPRFGEDPHYDPSDVRQTPKKRSTPHRKGNASTTYGVADRPATNIKEVKYYSLSTPSGRPERVDFTQFWHYYPRKEKMGRAEATWSSLSESEQVDAFIGSVRLSEIYKAADAERRQYTSQPSNWLVDRQWVRSDEDVEVFYQRPGHFMQERANQQREQANIRQRAAFKKTRDDFEERIERERLEAEGNKDE